MRAAALVLSAVMGACAATHPDAADVAVYAAQIGNCDRVATSRADDDTCKAAVRAYYCAPDGGVWLDAGVCSRDGGL